MRGITLLALLVALAAGNTANAQSATEPPSETGSLLYVWLHTIGHEGADFLAVIDADETSARYGEVLTTVPAGDVRGHAHHTPLTLPESGTIFANDYRGGHTYIYDATTPGAPRLKGSFGRIGVYSFPHSFAELPNGNILATFQSKREGNLVPGGLVEMTTDGELVRAADADPRDPAVFVRPYGMVLLPTQDRLVVTTFDMKQKEVARHIQIWRLSDLRLLGTVPVPAPEGKDFNGNPFEGRVLEDGETVLLGTLSCGLYLLDGLTAEEPERGVTMKNVHDFGGQYCGVPTRRGRFWIQPVETEAEDGPRAVVVLDVSNPGKPVETARVSFGVGFGPHWTSPNREGTKIAVTGYGEHLSRRILILTFDPEDGQLHIDERFGKGDEAGPGLLVDRETWPHGDAGPAQGHGAIFWPPAAPDWRSE